MQTNKQVNHLNKTAISLCISIITLWSSSTLYAADNNNKYSMGYQSYFKKQSDIKIQEESTKKISGVIDHSQSNSSTKLVVNPEQSIQVQKQETLSQKNKDKSQDITKIVSQKSKQPQGGDLLFIANSNDVPASWLAIDDNLSAGGLHGNLRSQVEIDNIRWKHHSDRDNGKYKYALLNAFLRHDELPNWYFGFYFAKEESYKGGVWDQSFQDNTNISEAFIGHIFETYRGNIGLEGMFGGESGLNRLKSRAKGWVDLRLTHNIKLGGYAFYEYQPYNNKPDNNDGHAVNIETEPNLTYILDNNNGIWISSLYKRNLQTRKQFGNILEVEQNVRIGFYHNWSKLFTSYYIGLGRLDKYNQQHSEEVFYKSNFKMIGTTASYPIVSGLRAYGEFKFKHTKEYGLWTEEGRNWNPFTIIGVVYEF